MSSFFPFTVYAEETRHWTRSAPEFQEAWRAIRPDNLLWYAYHVTVKSPDEITFIIHSMRDMCTGGVGDEIGRFDATVSRKITRPSIERQATALAREKRRVELAVAEKKTIGDYQKQILEEALSS